MEEITKVIFRQERKRDGGAIVAVFPEIIENDRMMSCFAHVGQHSICSREWYSKTLPAFPDSYARLQRELESPPYNYRLRVIKRLPTRGRGQ